VKRRTFGRSRIVRRLTCGTCGGFWQADLDRFNSCEYCNEGRVRIWRKGAMYRAYTRRFPGVCYAAVEQRIYGRVVA
jgi:hypothetical protein